MTHRKTGAGSSTEAEPLHVEWLDNAQGSHEVLHSQTWSFLLDRAVGVRVDVTSGRQEVQVALWCSEELKNSCLVREKPYLCHVFGDFSPKGHGVIKNKKTKLKKSIAISVSSAGSGKLMKEMWVRALTCRKEKSGWKVVGAQGQRWKGAQSRRYGQVHQSLKKREVNSRGFFFFGPSCPEGSLLLVSSSKL